MEQDQDQNQDVQAAPEAPASAADPDSKPEEKIPYELLALDEKEGCSVEVRVRVPWDEYQKHFEDMFGELKKSAVVDGFRKGKVPLPLLKARFKDDVRDDVLNKIIPNVMEQVEVEKKIKVASDPVLVDKKVDDGQPVEIAVTAEIFKDVEITEADLKDVKIEMDEVKVADEDVDKMIEQQRFSASLIEPAGDDAVFEKGMIITGRVTPLDASGKEQGPAQEDAQIDSETSELDEDIMALLEGKKAGDTVEIPRKNAEGEPDPAAGSLRLNIAGLKKRVKPDLDDEFAKDLGYDSLAAYKDDARKKIETDRRREAERKAIDDVVRQIAEKKNVQAPASAVEEQARHDLVRFFGHMRVSREEAAELYEGIKRSSEFNLKRSMVLKGFKEYFNVEVTDEDVDKRIEEMAAAEGRKPLAVRAKLEAEKRLDALKDDLLMETINKKVLEAASK